MLSRMDVHKWITSSKCLPMKIFLWSYWKCIVMHCPRASLISQLSAENQKVQHLTCLIIIANIGLYTLIMSKNTLDGVSDKGVT